MEMEKTSARILEYIKGEHMRFRRLERKDDGGS
jgi:hypothetical protein